MNSTKERHPLSGETVILNCKHGDPYHLNGRLYTIEDWWENLGMGYWMDCNGNFACMKYGLRAGVSDLPIDNEVVYGKVNGLGYLIHVSELGEVVEKGCLSR